MWFCSMIHGVGMRMLPKCFLRNSTPCSPSSYVWCLYYRFLPIAWTKNKNCTWYSTEHFAAIHGLLCVFMFKEHCDHLVAPTSRIVLVAIFCPGPQVDACLQTTKPGFSAGSTMTGTPFPSINVPGSLSDSLCCGDALSEDSKPVDALPSRDCWLRRKSYSQSWGNDGHQCRLVQQRTCLQI